MTSCCHTLRNSYFCFIYFTYYSLRVFWLVWIKVWYLCRTNSSFQNTVNVKSLLPQLDIQLINGLLFYFVMEIQNGVHVSSWTSAVLKTEVEAQAEYNALVCFTALWTYKIRQGLLVVCFICILCLAFVLNWSCRSKFK